MILLSKMILSARAIKKQTNKFVVRKGKKFRRNYKIFAEHHKCCLLACRKHTFFSADLNMFNSKRVLAVRLV